MLLLSVVNPSRSIQECPKKIELLVPQNPFEAKSFLSYPDSSLDPDLVVPERRLVQMIPVVERTKLVAPNPMVLSVVVPLPMLNAANLVVVLKVMNAMILDSLASKRRVPRSFLELPKTPLKAIVEVANDNAQTGPAVLRVTSAVS